MSPGPRIARIILTGGLAASCVSGVPETSASAAPAASQSLPPGDIGFGRFADARDLSLRFLAWSSEGEDEARYLETTLPDAWRTATAGLGTVSIYSDDAAITVLVLTARTKSFAGGRIVTLNVGGMSRGNELRVLLHELGHALGCCFGRDADKTGHWVSCDPAGELMCADGGRGRVARFSDRELRVLRLRP